VLIGAAYAFAFTYLMLVIINLITPVKTTEKVEEIGIDQALHGEKAYDEGAL
jgi:Amt family ammonium transporter